MSVSSKRRWWGRRERWAALLWLLTAASVVGGCPERASWDSLVVVIDADPALRSEVQRLRVTTPSSLTDLWLRDAPRGEPRQNWPAHHTFYARRGESGSIEVEAWSKNKVIVRRQHRVTFAAGRRALHVYLAADCRDQRCGARQTCGDCGRCVPQEVAGSELRAVESESAAVVGVHAPACGPGSGADGGADGGVEGGADGGAADAAPPVAALALEVPPVIATEACVALRVQRALDMDEAAVFNLSVEAGSLHATASCSDAPSLSFAAGESERTFYYRAPNALSGGRGGSEHFHVSSGEASADAESELRLRAVAVSGGALFHCWLLSDGALYCAGASHSGALGMGFDPVIAIDPAERATAVAGLSAASRTVAEATTVCALSQGAVSCWGDGPLLGAGSASGSGTPVSATGLDSGVAQLDLGLRHACAVKDDHSLWCWGDNASKACANDSDGTKLVPFAVTSFADARECAAGNAFTCARNGAGEVYCWGQGAASWPQQVALAGYPAKRLVATGPQACAVVDAAGQDQLRCWQMQGAGAATLTSSVVSGLPAGPIEQVASSLYGEASCAQVGEELYCWGQNKAHQLGTESALESLASPSRVQLPAGDLSAFAFGTTALGVTLTAIVDGLPYSWGAASHGDLGLGGWGLHLTPTPVTVMDGFDVAELRIGFASACLLTTASELRCWGLGGLGVASLPYGFSNEPRVPDGLSQIAQVSMASAATYARTSAGALYAWGIGSPGHLGTGTIDDQPQPTLASAVAALGSSVEQVASTIYRACARLQNGTVWCWGLWNDGTGVPVTDPVRVEGLPAGVTDIAVGQGKGCALAAGAVSCWGALDESQSPPFTVTNAPELANADDIDGSEATLCARIGAQGVCSFSADSSFTTVFADDVKELRAGPKHACALSTDGILSCAGSNDQGEVGHGTFRQAQPAAAVTGLVPPVTEFAPGSPSCARDAEGWKCWGDNAFNLMVKSPGFYTVPTLLPPWQ